MDKINIDFSKKLPVIVCHGKIEHEMDGNCPYCEITSLRNKLKEYQSINKRYLSAIVSGEETEYNQGFFKGQTTILKELSKIETKNQDRCKHLYADWCHKPERCVDTQELCCCYHDNKKCPDFETSMEGDKNGHK